MGGVDVQEPGAYKTFVFKACRRLAKRKRGHKAQRDAQQKAAEALMVWMPTWKQVQHRFSRGVQDGFLELIWE